MFVLIFFFKDTPKSYFLLNKKQTLLINFTPEYFSMLRL